MRNEIGAKCFCGRFLRISWGMLFACLRSSTKIKRIRQHNTTESDSMIQLNIFRIYLRSSRDSCHWASSNWNWLAVIYFVMFHTKKKSQFCEWRRFLVGAKIYQIVLFFVFFFCEFLLLTVVFVQFLSLLFILSAHCWFKMRNYYLQTTFKHWQYIVSYCDRLSKLPLVSIHSPKNNNTVRRDNTDILV